MNTDVNLARITLLAICDELDIKGRFSNKHRVWTNDQPCDVLGFLMQRLGYTYRDEYNNTNGPRDIRLEKILGVASYTIQAFYSEIDRASSTNESIRALFKTSFDNQPIRTTLPSDIRW